MNCTMLQKLVIAQCRRNINCDVYRKTKKFSTFSQIKQKKITIPVTCPVQVNICIYNRSFHNGTQYLKNVTISKKGIQENISTLQLKKRPLRKKNAVVGEETSSVPGVWNIKALATAEQYNLEGLEAGLLNQQLYTPHKICTSNNLEDVSYNICDQRFHEFEIRKQNSDIKVIRRTLTDMTTTAKLGSNKELIVEDFVVSVVYYRCGYEPGQYHTEREWDARLLIERSLAIKCPSIQYHLAGTKKVQQALAKPGVIARFLKDERNVLNIEEIFTALPDVIHAIAKYEVGNEPRELYFFREGTVLMWNISDLESGNILEFLKYYEENSYTFELIHTESESMTYTYSESGKKCQIKDGNIILTRDATNMEKYTFSNAIAQSVKLGIWEASLDHYINSIEFVTEDLKTGKKLRMSQREVLRKQGELFALRHLINLSSDLLDTPDFYWERDDLENLYQQIYGYFNIAKRTRVMNEKLNHCVELVGILSSHLSDRHHIRLEWMIIILIMVEVAFETLHYVDRYLVK